MKPETYIDSLREMNGGKPQKALRFAAPSAAKPTGAPPQSAPNKQKKEPVALAPSPAVEVSGATR
jgi:hypothetical protein